MYKEIGNSFSKFAKDNGIVVQTCSEKHNLVEYGFINGNCLSQELALKLTGKKYPLQHVRKSALCKCIQMVDIGVYNTCTHLCKYCYANYNEKDVFKNNKLHNPNSPLLIGNLQKDDIIKERFK